MSTPSKLSEEDEKEKDLAIFCLAFELEGEQLKAAETLANYMDLQDAELASLEQKLADSERDRNFANRNAAKVCARLSALIAEKKQQANRIKTLEAALEPFAKLVDVPSYDVEFHWDYELPRRAAAALKGEG